MQKLRIQQMPVERAGRMSEKNLIVCPPGIPVSRFLLEQGISIRTDCGGRGNCAHCLIRVVKGRTDVSDMTKIQLTREQIEAGIRLACHVVPKEEITVELI